MALITGGTTATTSLSGLKFLPGYGSGNTAADLAAFNLAIKSDLNATHPRVQSGFVDGWLHIPGNRGTIRALPGDYVFVDSQGWPIIVSANSIANAAWTHT